MLEETPDEWSLSELLASQTRTGPEWPPEGFVATVCPGTSSPRRPDLSVSRSLVPPSSPTHPFFAKAPFVASPPRLQRVRITHVGDGLGGLGPCSSAYRLTRVRVFLLTSVCLLSLLPASRTRGRSPLKKKISFRRSPLRSPHRILRHYYKPLIAPLFDTAIKVGFKSYKRGSISDY